MRSLAFVAALVGACAEPVSGAQNMLGTKILSIGNPGGVTSRRRLVYVSMETPAELVGSPVTSGARLRVQLASGGDQCFDLAAEGWRAIGDLGFKYTAPSGPGAVVAALIKREAFSGDFILKAKAAGRAGSIDVLPMPGTTGFATNFSIGGGDEYCSGGPTPLGSADTESLYKVKRVPAPAACSVTACP